MYTSMSFSTYDSRDMKELEFQRALLETRATSHGKFSSASVSDSTMMWSLASSWNTQVEYCQRCGNNATTKSGDFDPSNGLWYCTVCWRQSQLMADMSSDEEDSDDEANAVQIGPNVDLKAGGSDDELSTIGSTPGEFADTSSEDSDSDLCFFTAPQPISKMSMLFWRQCQLKTATSIAEEHSDDDASSESMSPNVGRKLRGSEEDDVSPVASTRADTSSGESDSDVTFVIRAQQVPKLSVQAPSNFCASSVKRSRRGQRSHPEASAVRCPPRESLQPSQDSWASQMQLRRKRQVGESAEQTSVAEVSRSARALLNKLTAERFEQLLAQLADLCAGPGFGQEHVSTLAVEIFNKATLDHSFCPLYADLCSRLDAQAFESEGPLQMHLVRECLNCFRRDMCADIEGKALEGLEGDAVYEMQVKLKRVRVGTVRFMGELFVRKLLPVCVLMSTMSELLETSGDGGAATELLVALLQVVAPKCESFEAPLISALKDIHSALRKRTTDIDFPARVRFLIKDLLDVLPSELTAEPCVCSEVQKASHPWSKEGRKSTTPPWRPTLKKRATS